MEQGNKLGPVFKHFELLCDVPGLLAGEAGTGFEWAGPGETTGEDETFLAVTFVVFVAEAFEMGVDDTDLAT